jgi:flavin reductase (DIM6/NTAB) family NADH-FMN oxidoreductase RutF
LTDSADVLTIDGQPGIDPSPEGEGSRLFRNTLGQFATGVTVVTALTPGGERLGITVTSFNSLSLDPPLILWSLARETASFSCFDVGSAFAVNVLAEAQDDLALQFARVGGPKFDGVPVHQGLDGLPLLEGCGAYFECLVESRHPGGDHDIIVGRVRRMFNTGKPPLLFHAGALRGLGSVSV